MSQQTPYIIVVDVDNVRAAKAFRKGYEDLLRLWPQIEAVNLITSEARRKEDEEEAERYRKEKEQFDKEMKAYLEWKPSFFNPRPTMPLPVHSSRWYYRSINTNYNWFLSNYESVRDDLKHCLNVAEAAVGPYRMSEHQVQAMVEWEDGSRIDAIKNEMAVHHKYKGAV